MEYLAHSERDGIPAQSYLVHVSHVKEKATKYAREAAVYAAKDGDLLIRCSEESGEWHDTGKLLKENQDVLHEKNSRSKLKIPHEDAGSAVMMQTWFAKENIPALAIYSHHRGLPDIASEEIKGRACYRDESEGGKNRRRVDAELDSLISLHRQLTGSGVIEKADAPTCDFGIFSRILLSCLADADHTDTAIHYRKYPADMESPMLRAKERLEKLDRYIEGLDVNDERNKLRAEMYRACKTAEPNANIVACDSPVGSGKTTAVMAHLLHEAIKRNARRVFVVLPFTNIIKQSVEVYRKALLLPGEKEEDVVAELHHRADFQSIDARAYSAQWRAPIIVTTAVAFFETIAANWPATLRRLHELPGSVIFVDEAHAALPVKLLPVAWHWMQILADEWSCYWMLASGSLVEFWKIPEIADSETHREVPQLVENQLREQLIGFEQRRISYPQIETPLSRKKLIERIKSEPGPRLVIMNTVQSAGVVAGDLLKSYQDQEGGNPCDGKVLHLSTALTAEDRDSVVNTVRERLRKLKETKSDLDADWTLVATSCVEAGVDFSFRVGFREISSLLSLLQAAGRISRNGEYDDAKIWSFSMQDDNMLTQNPGTKDSESVLNRFFQRGLTISPALCTQAIIAELNRQPENQLPLLKEELKLNYQEVGERFNVIESNTVLVIADTGLKHQIRCGKCDWREIQRKAIPMRLYLVKKLSLQKLTYSKDDKDCLYDWNLPYDTFLGTMAGVLYYLQSQNEFLCM